MPPRPPELRPYRIFMYVLFGALGAVASILILRSVVGDLFFGARAGQPKPPTAAACVDDVGRLYDALTSRTAQPPANLAGDSMSLDWDRWSRRWEDELSAVSGRCRLDGHLEAALDGLENLLRALNRSGREIGREAAEVSRELKAARESLKSGSK